MRDPGGVQRIGFALGDRRERQGVSRKDLARVVGTTVPYLERFERGEVNPRLDLVLRLGSALGWVWVIR